MKEIFTSPTEAPPNDDESGTRTEVTGVDTEVLKVQDSLIELEAKESIPESDNRSPEQIKLAETLQREFGVTYDIDTSLEDLKDNYKMLQKVRERGLISCEDGRLIINRVQLDEFINRSHRGRWGGAFSKKDFFKALSNQIAFEAIADRKNEGETIYQESVFLPTPKTQEDLIDFGHISASATVNLWEMGGREWGRQIELEDGMHTSYAELYVVNLLDKLGARRRNNVLEIIDPKSGTYRKFSINYLRSIGFVLPQINSSESGDSTPQITHFAYSPSAFSQKYLSNLLELDILRLSDFDRAGGTDEENLYGSRRVRIDEKRPVGFTNKDGVSGRYFISETMVGAQKEDEIEMQKIDADTVGIFINGELTKTLRLADTERLLSLREEAKENRPNLSHSELTSFVYLGAKECATLIDDYDITKYVIQRDGESPVEYARRVTRFSNYDKVVGASSFQGFLAEADFSAISLPWGEQIVLAEILQKIPKEKIVRFAKQYGADGIRTFLSADTDEQMIDNIFELEKHFDVELLKKLFSKYAQIIDSTRTADAVLDSVLDKSVPDDTRDQVRREVINRMFARAKELIATFLEQKDTYGNGVADKDSMSRRLDRVNENVHLYASMFKALYDTEGSVSPEMLLEHSTEEYSPSEISPEDKKEMLELDIDTREKDYPRALLDIGHSSLEEALNESGDSSTFYLLKHKGAIVAYIKIQRLDGENYYAGSLNVRDEAKGSKIGHMLLSQILDEKAKEASIKAVALPTIPIYNLYLTRYGFEERGPIENYHGTGHTLMQLFRPKSVPPVEEVAQAA